MGVLGGLKGYLPMRPHVKARECDILINLSEKCVSGCLKGYLPMGPYAETTECDILRNLSQKCVLGVWGVKRDLCLWGHMLRPQKVIF